MKYKIKNKLLALALLSFLNTSIVGCGKTDALVKDEPVIEANADLPSDSSEEEFIELASVSSNSAEESISSNTVTEKSEVEKEEEEVTIVSVPVIVANEKVEIKGEDSTLLGYLPEGKSIEYTDVLDTGLYQVNYFGKVGYIDSSKVSESNVYDIESEIKNIYYAEEDTELIIPDYLSESGEDEVVPINKLECFEVYKDIGDYFLVQTIDYTGYVKKDNLKELTGTFIVVDISEQLLILYKDNEVILESPVVTGTPTKSRSTSEGVFEIYDITHNRYLVGPTWRSYVNIMMKFHNNEGFHDAEYHTDDNGRSHGWRNSYEFGGDTYTFDGSHGCVNMLHDDVMTLSLYAENGTKTIIKP